MAMTPDQVEQAASLTAEIEALIAASGAHDAGRLDEFAGPFGRTLSAICTYRALSVLPSDTKISEAMKKTAEMIVVYSAGIVAGAGHGIGRWPDEETHLADAVAEAAAAFLTRTDTARPVVRAQRPRRVQSRMAYTRSIRAGPGDLRKMRSVPFAEAVRRCRLQSGMSQRAVGRATGLSYMTVSRVEQGVEPRLGTFLRLCGWAGLDPAAFLRAADTAGEGTLDAVEACLREDPLLDETAAAAIFAAVSAMHAAAARPPKAGSALADSTHQTLTNGG